MSGPRAGCPGRSPDVRLMPRISGSCLSPLQKVVYFTPDVRVFAGYPGLPVSPDVRALSRMSGPLLPIKLI